MSTDTGATGASPVRETVTDYWPHAEHVSINEAALEDFAAVIADESIDVPEWKMPNFISTDAPDEDVLDFLFLINTVNFAFRDFVTGERFAAELHGDEWPGAFGMIACFRRAYDAGEPILDGDHLANLDRDDVAALFEPSNGVKMPMLDERTEILNAVGERLVNGYGGRFYEFIDDVGNTLYGDNGVAARLVAEFPSYRDERRVETGAGWFTVRFDKRAQLAVAMAHSRLPDDTFRVADPESFTVFADYNLPNILRHHGVIEYSRELADPVDAGTPIPEGSRMETDLRAATITATDHLCSRLNDVRDESVTGMHLDAALFGMKEDVDTPVHKTRTTAY